MVPPADFDEDEDLFNFDELYDEPAVATSQEIDVDEFLAAVDHGATPDDLGGYDDEGPSAMDSVLDLPELDPTGDLLNTGAALPGGSGYTAQRDPALPLPGRSGGPRQVETVAVSTSIPKIVWVGAGFLALLNLMAVFVVWSSQKQSTDQLDRVRDELSEVARDVRDDVQRQVETIQRTTAPLVVPAGLPAGSFDRIDDALARHDFASARRQLFAALSVADALDDAAKQDFQAQAEFLLADTYRLEALSREDGIQ
ncbi:hypothetical protein [Engelhardtia mirabilis]|uniref:Uncharacterized protein n=1 Tax=Engelhardtia mirabilis TaxID=2528011 RepID=A0A518BSS5_9BACT|nr:hypothetical protein Pla133_51410 [Planctomycetes bacterium Pla133]QDV04343.1 hypothetical protein Pla86_51380 [Planctomycetes bacterium Pla86]